MLLPITLEHAQCHAQCGMSTCRSLDGGPRDDGGNKNGGSSDANDAEDSCAEPCNLMGLWPTFKTNMKQGPQRHLSTAAAEVRSEFNDQCIIEMESSMIEQLAVFGARADRERLPDPSIPSSNRFFVSEDSLRMSHGFEQGPAAWTHAPDPPRLPPGLSHSQNTPVGESRSRAATPSPNPRSPRRHMVPWIATSDGLEAISHFNALQAQQKREERGERPQPCPRDRRGASEEERGSPRGAAAWKAAARKHVQQLPQQQQEQGSRQTRDGFLQRLPQSPRSPDGRQWRVTGERVCLRLANGNLPKVETASELRHKRQVKGLTQKAITCGLCRIVRLLCGRP